MFNYLVVAEAQNTTLGTMIVVTLSIVLLLAAIKKFAWGAIVNILTQREEKISNDIDSAEKSKIEAESLKEKRASELLNSKTEAVKIVQDSKDYAEKNRQSLLAEARQEANQLKEKAKTDIAVEKELAFVGIKKDVASLSVEIAAKILKKELNEETHSALIDSYIEGLDNK